MSPSSKNLILLLPFLTLNLINSSCVAGQNQCISCHPLTNLCTQCIYSVYKPDLEGGCEKAEKCIGGENYCIECNKEGNLCESCELGYFPDNNGGCSYTANCEISYNGECLKCAENFILLGEQNKFKICKYSLLDDYKNCNNINNINGFCKTCEENYYLTKNDYKCVETNYCLESSLGICKKCIKGYYLDKRKDICIKQENNFLNCKITIDGKYCEECDDDYFYSKDEKCIESNYCFISENNICKQCINDYYLSTYNKVCTNIENCRNGDGKNGICLSCNENYYYNKITGECLSNQENNKYKNCFISDNDSCLECLNKYKLGEDKKCSNSYNCAESENSICQKCDSNHHLDLENYCSSIEHCIHSGGFISICYECEEGFYFSRSTFKCLDDSDENVKNCKYSDYYSEYCVECRDNFYLNTTNNKCYSNTDQSNFYKCKKSDSIDENYLECSEKYYLGSGDL